MVAKDADEEDWTRKVMQGTGNGTKWGRRQSLDRRWRERDGTEEEKSMRRQARNAEVLRSWWKGLGELGLTPLARSKGVWGWRDWTWEAWTDCCHYRGPIAGQGRAWADSRRCLVIRSKMGESWQVFLTRDTVWRAFLDSSALLPFSSMSHVTVIALDNCPFWCLT